MRVLSLVLLLASWQVLAGEVPERIVAAGGSLTEIVYALGEQSRLAGVDTTSNYPEAAKSLPQIGYKRALAAEGILALNPQLVLATEDAGPTKVLEQIAAAGVPLKSFSAAPTLLAVEEKIKGIANLLGKPEAGDALWQQVEQQVVRARANNARVTEPARVLFILSLSDRGPMVGGANTHADSIIKLAGGVNAVTDIEGYKPVSIEAVMAMQPDVILMMQRSEMSGETGDIFARPGFDQTPAAENRRLVTLDGMLMLGFGPRIGEAIEQLNRAFYPRSATRP